MALIAAMNDAWNFVDSVNRLRLLIDRCPGLQRSGIAYKRFSHATSGIKNLRNFAQHLNAGISKLAPSDLPVWGTLNWLTVVDARALLARSSTIVLGSLFQAIHPLISLEGRTSFREVEAIALRAGGQTVVLSDIPERMELFVLSVEAGLRQATVGARTLRSDFVVRADVDLSVAESEGEESVGANERLLSYVMGLECNAHVDVGTVIDRDAVYPGT